jgi:putative two-component system response regulator
LRILILDDDPMVSGSLAMALGRAGYTVDVANSPSQAVELAKSNLFDLALCDVRMPQADGIDALGALRSIQSGLRGIVITGYASDDAPVRAIKRGVDDYILKPCPLDDLLRSVRHSLTLRQLELDSQQAIQTLRNRYLNLIIQLVSSFHKSDAYLFEHATRVAALAVEAGNALHLSEESLESLEMAAWLHDLGPLAWQRQVEGFAEEQWRRLQLHPVVSSQLLNRLTDLAPVKKILSNLREHYDGSGLPGQRAGADIPMESQLVAVCEYFDHLAWPRPGVAALPLPDLQKQIQGLSGQRFHPQVVAACLDVSRDFRPLEPARKDPHYRDLRLRLHRLLELAVVFREGGDLAAARQALEESTQVAGRIDGPGYAPWIQSEMALLELASLQNEQARQLAHQAHQAIDSAAPAQRGRVQRNLGLLYLGLDMAQPSWEMAGAALRWYEQRGDAVSAASMRDLRLRAAFQLGPQAFGVSLEEWLEQLPRGYLINLPPQPRRQLLPLLREAMQRFPQRSELSECLHQLEPSTPQPLAPSPPQVLVYCLGKLKVQIGENVLRDWRSRKAQELFAYLCKVGQPIPAERLAEVLWPESGTRELLHTTVYRVRRALKLAGQERELVLNERNFYLLDPQVALWLDFQEFEKLIQDLPYERDQLDPSQLMRAEQALQLHRGSFLDGMFEDWILETRYALEQKWFRLATLLAAHYARLAQISRTQEIYSAMLERDPEREETYLLLIPFLLQSGQREQASRRYQDYLARMQELGLPPDPDLARRMREEVN